jgi:hypothetical protein
MAHGVGSWRTEADVEARIPDTPDDHRPHVRTNMSVLNIVDRDAFAEGHFSRAEVEVVLT